MLIKHVDVLSLTLVHVKGMAKLMSNNSCLFSRICVNLNVPTKLQTLYIKHIPNQVRSPSFLNILCKHGTMTLEDALH